MFKVEFLQLKYFYHIFVSANKIDFVLTDLFFVGNGIIAKDINVFFEELCFFLIDKFFLGHFEYEIDEFG
jgi:hypothetical protein